MAKTLSIIGIELAELRWIRMLIFLLRHPDPSIPELARQALVYLSEAASKRERSALSEAASKRERSAEPRRPAG
jgi:hypothetical protein